MKIKTFVFLLCFGTLTIGCEKSIKSIRSLFGKSLPAPMVSKEFLSIDKNSRLYLAVADSKTEYRFKGRCDLETKDLWVKMPGLVTKVQPRDGGAPTELSLDDWQMVNRIASPESKIDCATGEFDFTIHIENAGQRIKPEAKFSFKGGAPVGESDVMEVPIIKADPLSAVTDAPPVENQPARYYISVMDSKPVLISPQGGLAPYEFRLLMSSVAGLPKDGRFDCRSFSNICNSEGEKKIRLRVVDSVLQQYDILLDLKPRVQARAFVPGSMTKVLFDSEGENKNPIEVPAGANIRIEARLGIVDKTSVGQKGYTFTTNGVGGFDNKELNLYRTKVDSFAANHLEDLITVADSRGNKVVIPVLLTAPLKLNLQGSKELTKGGSLVIAAKGGKAPYIFSVDKVDGKEVGTIKIDKGDSSKAVFRAANDTKGVVYPVIRVIDDFGNSDKTAQGSENEVKLSN